MWDEYKKVNDSIHVPEELVNRTVKAAEREERRRKIIGLWKYTAIAENAFVLSALVYGERRLKTRL